MIKYRQGTNNEKQKSRRIFSRPLGERIKVRGIFSVKKPKPIGLARHLRRKESDAERKLWSKLHSRQFENVKFRRQHPIGKYIVDFVSLKKKIVIEIDGGQHNETGNREKDELRTAWLENEGYHVIRFWNNDVLTNIDGVGAKMWELIQAHF
jgi:very-short-patch-repair endonuclease